MAFHPWTTPVHASTVSWLKVVAIVAVVTAHSGAFFFSLQTVGLDRFVRVVLAAFHVPVFLLVSGYLHATATPIMWNTIWRRWRSVLGPYVLASVAMLALAVERDLPVSQWGSPLLIGNAVGIYYYVPVWLFCVMTGWLWSRLAGRALAAAMLVVTALTLGRQQWPQAYGFVWSLRDPFLMGWLFCYLFGWCARRFRWDDWIAENRWSIVLALMCCFRWVCLPDGAPPLTRIVFSVGVAWMVAALCVRPAPARVAWLAHETLFVYLWHLPITMYVYDYLHDWPAVLRLPAIVGATLAILTGGIAVFRMAQRAVQPRVFAERDSWPADVRRAA